MNHDQPPNVHTELATLDHVEPPAQSTYDQLGEEIASELASYWQGRPSKDVASIAGPLAKQVMDVVAPALAEKDTELERLHNAWEQQRQQINRLTIGRHHRVDDQPAAEEWRVSGDLADYSGAPFTPPRPPESAEWRTGDPEPPADAIHAVRGHRTQRIYFRETPAPGGRWIHRQSGDWCRWDYLIHFEQSVQQFNVGGTS